MSLLLAVQLAALNYQASRGRGSHPVENPKRGCMDQKMSPEQANTPLLAELSLHVTAADLPLVLFLVLPSE